MERNTGSWTLRTLSDGMTLARYALDVNLRGTIPTSVSDWLVGKTLPETLQRFKDRVESAKG
jgi:hypothetical protein